VVSRGLGVLSAEDFVLIAMATLVVGRRSSRVITPGTAVNGVGAVIFDRIGLQMGGQWPIFYLLFSLRKPSFNLFNHRLELRKRLGEVGRNKHCVLHSLGPHFGFNCLVVTVPWQHAIRGSGLGFPRWKLTSVEIEPLGQNILFGAIKSVLTFS
jgi:hypothetical protein